MRTRLIIDGNSVYEIDEECEVCMKQRKSHAACSDGQTGNRSRQGRKKEEER